MYDNMVSVLKTIMGRVLKPSQFSDVLGKDLPEVDLNAKDCQLSDSELGIGAKTRDALH